MSKERSEVDGTPRYAGMEDGRLAICGKEIVARAFKPVLPDPLLSTSNELPIRSRLEHEPKCTVLETGF